MTAIVTGADLTHAVDMNLLRIYGSILTNSPGVAPPGQVSVWDTVRHEFITAGTIRSGTIPIFAVQCYLWDTPASDVGQCRWRRPS